jgi:hypothetical protein
MTWLLARIVGVLLILGVLYRLLPLFLIAGIGYLLFWGATMLWLKWCEKIDSERARLSEICARADEQHNWVMQGDPRGTYGEETVNLLCKNIGGRTLGSAFNLVGQLRDV